MRPTSVAALVLTAVLAGGCGSASSTHDGDPGEVTSSGWRHLADAPLSERDGPVVAVVAGDVVVVGGSGGRPCPPGADCAAGAPPERDGAAYDPETGTWHPIADAPQGVPESSDAVVLGDRLYVLAGPALLVWSAGDDAWAQLTPPSDVLGSSLVVNGEALVLAHNSDEHGAAVDPVLDPATGRWSVLPSDPLAPAYDRTLTSTSAGLVLTAAEIDDDGDPVDPALVHAALLPPGGSSWREFPVTGQLASGPWTWTGTRMVDATTGGSDGGEVGNYGRVLPLGGRLDPATGVWSALPDAPSAGSGGWPVDAGDGSRVAAGGWLYDDRLGSWAVLPRPVDSPEGPGSAVWLGQELIVYGGGSWVTRDGAQEWVRSTTVWSYRP